MYYPPAGGYGAPPPQYPSVPTAYPPSYPPAPAGAYGYPPGVFFFL
jgi:hypothetical protein